MIGRDGLYCDICEQKLKHYVHLPARSRDCPVWGWYEGHAACLKSMPRPNNIVFGRRERRKWQTDKDILEDPGLEGYEETEDTSF